MPAVLALVAASLAVLPTPVPAASHCTPPIANAIVCENSLPGNPASEWDVSGSGSATIQGFSTDISVDQGQTVRFKVSTPSSNYRLDIYRMGYYAGSGARRVATVQPSASLPQSQPSCLNNAATGLIDCGNWGESASWAVPATAVSGIYFARLVREDGPSGASHVMFIVRDDDGRADVLFQTSDTTWQAYNQYGGNSLYVGAPAGRAYKVSYNRPFTTRDGSAEDWVFNAEYPMVRWLESNGYSVSYSTGIDTDRLGAELLEHKVFMAVGHDEYWSGNQRTNVEAARAAGVNLAFFTGNEVFWKTRWEPSIDGSNTAYRTLVSYKETHADAKIDPSSQWTGTWRDPRFSPPSDGGRPENALTGTIFTVNCCTYSMTVPEADGKMRFWRNTSVATLAPGATATLPNGTLGYEWDEDLDNGFRPPGLVGLSTTTVNVGEKLQDLGSTYAAGSATHSLTLYRHSSGALVFGAGTVQWSWGLDADHDRGSASADIRMQQATMNLLADMATQPATRQGGLVAATASTDTAAPTSTIASPAVGTTVNPGTNVTISGTANDTGGGRVGGVEVSTDGGTTWRRATGRGSWTYTWTVPNTPGPVTIRSRAADDSARIQTATTSVAVTIAGTPGGGGCPCSIWNPTTVPAVAAESDPSAVELGVKFRADTAGSITGIRFYKGATNTGTHVGSLWSSTGTKLASATFTGETASGWQQVNFSGPVAVTANTTYVASYFAPNGNYAVNSGFFTADVVNGPLRALANGTDGPNGLYAYGASSFPNSTFNASNYWVDVVFASSTGPDTSPPTVASTTPVAGASAVTVSDNVTATFSETVQAATVAFTLTDPANVAVPAAVSYDGASRTVTLNPNADLAPNTTFTARVSGARDTAGNTMAAPFTWTFTTRSASGCPCSIWSDATVPGVAAENDPGAVELGVKFRADVSGFITGVRFYKGATNTGTHVGSLWSATGTKLASATFTGETASGWQQVSFPSPVAVTANTTYVASYHAPNGNYAVNSGFFATEVFNAPLRALADGTDGPNGLYAYGASSFPTSSFGASNYWVDVVFANAVGPDTTPPTVTSTSPVAGDPAVPPSDNVTATFSESVQAGTISFTLTNPANVAVPAAVSYDGSSRTVTLNPSADLAATTTYTARVSGAADAAGNVMTAPVTWTFTTRAIGGCPCSIWSASTLPGIAAENDTSAVEVGVRFRSDTAGFITGIRFYKGAANTGTHIGSLWTSTGTKLAVATFTSETATGWQQVNLGSPVAISANTTYVASYHAPNGNYALNSGYFGAEVVNAPLRALANGADGPNGVYGYGPSSFPATTDNASNYWVDVVFNTTVPPDTTRPTVTSTAPPTGAVGVVRSGNVNANFSESVQAPSISFTLTDPANVAVPATITYDNVAFSATLDPSNDLAPSTTYTARVSGATDPAGNTMAAPFSWTFTTAAPPPPPPDDGPGGPILVLGQAANPFGRYFAEILRNEGLNAFRGRDLASVTATELNAYDVVVLGQATLTDAQVTMLTNWVNAGGNLIASRPDKKLAALLGLTDAASTLTGGYILVNTAAAPGAGIVGETMQFQGTADRYTLNGAASVATLYSNATTATTNPAVTLRGVGASGGQAAAFTYDLARSIVYSRQGNPAWAGTERDGQSPIRSDDFFYGPAAGDPKPDWIDFSKVAIPQADEQQRLLVNLIQHMNRDRKPLPKFWYLPRGLKAAVVMTGDDHANGGTAGRFETQKAQSPPGCSVVNWECIRSTSYIYAATPLTDAAAATYVAQGFEVGAHITTGCANWSSRAQLEPFYSGQLAEWRAKYTSLPSPATNRTHCIAWADWANQALVEGANGIRLDTNYYYWPAGWVLDRPGFFTGSGMPMRFADVDGSLIDVYQATTQMNDEAAQSFPVTSDTLLDGALGPKGYYGVFTANMHTDLAAHADSDAIVASAKARGVPVVTGRQMLEWLDGRNSSSFGSLAWSGNTLSFTVAVGAGANGIEAMVPIAGTTGALQSITRGAAAVPFVTKVVKGVEYGVFAAAPGAYQAVYGADTAAPTVATRTPAPGAAGVLRGADVVAAFSEAVDPATIAFTLTDAGTPVPGAVTYDAGTRTATFNPTADLAFSKTYAATVSGAKDLAGNAMAAPSTWSFTTLGAPTCPCSIWSSSTVPGVTAENDPNAIEVGVKFRADVDGFITGIRFYKGATNTGTHVGSLWTSAGARLASATFTGETASGWQQVTFASPVAVTANTTYVASYHAPNGRYAANAGYFTTGVDNAPLRALANGVDGPNGLFTYGASSFPTNSFNAGNYWVDVVFTSSTGPDTTPPAVSSTVPAAGATGVPGAGNVTATFNEAVDPATILFSLTDAGTPVPAAVTYDAASRTATLNPTNDLAVSRTYAASVSGARDLAGNTMPAAVTWSFTTAGAPTCPCSIWSTSTVPGVTAVNDPGAVEVGVKFRADTAGFITGIRFYKGATNTGTHVGSLWSATGTKLAGATFTGETASGWQQVNFSTPVAVSANTTYVASYHAPNGNYAANSGYFTTAVSTPPLQALANGVDGTNGVYAYGASSFPTNSFNAANYWVDVVFTNSVGPDTTPPTVATRSPAAGATGVARSANVTATFSEDVDPATVTFTLTDAGTPVPAAVSYDAIARTATLNPTSDLAASRTYAATVSGARDLAGNTMAAPASWSFTTVAPPSCPCTIWAASAVPAVAAESDASAVEVGVKFRTDVAGSITGIRFYKGATNTGTHVASLWTATGTKLASATFTGETASGWQQVNFATPVAVAANTTYVASYHAPNGNYAVNGGFFTAAVVRAPLTALANGTDGPNGVYAYGASSFPTSTFDASNYWVDVVFTVAP